MGKKKPLALADNTLLDLYNSSYLTQPCSIIGKYDCSIEIKSAQAKSLDFCLFIVIIIVYDFSIL